MASPLVSRHGRRALLPPLLFPPADYYAILASYPEAAVDTAMRYDKRFKQAHRYDIADTRGRLTLTVPHSSPGPERTWEVTPISAHGRWWEVHRVALESAYGRTPFFEFYIDRFLPLFSEPATGDTVGSLVRRADSIVRAIICPDTHVSYCDASSFYPDTDDFRRYPFPCAPSRPYYQVRAGSLGFIGGLSVLDLIFNMGPESPLILQEISKKLPLAEK